MNNKGFTLIELLVTLVVLTIVAGISISAINFDFGSAKSKSEEVFVDTIKDAMDIYLSSDGRGLNYVLNKGCTISKKHGNVNVYKAEITFLDVINSEYKPISSDDLINPSNKKKCNVNALITIYRDEDFVYYYNISKDGLECLKNIGVVEENGVSVVYSDVISSLPDRYSCK